jgi:hypothetical protein
MKYLTYLLVCLLLVISSCKKTEIPGPGPLVGSWMWVYTWNDGAPGPTNPLTPQNGGFGEYLDLNSDYSWTSSIYGSTIKSMLVIGNFSIGHGRYTPYKGAYTYDYDSIVFYKNSVYSDATVEYFRVSNDTLMFCSCFSGLIGSTSKTYVKQSD